MMMRQCFVVRLQLIAGLVSHVSVSVCSLCLCPRLCACTQKEFQQQMEALRLALDEERMQRMQAELSLKEVFARACVCLILSARPSAINAHAQRLHGVCVFIW